jgi:hypothetical protein
MLTHAAHRSPPELSDQPPSVLTRAQLAARGISRHHIAAHCAAHRWQLWGAAVVLHNGALSRRQRWLVARINCGPQVVLTAFTAAEAFGLRGWERDRIHLLGPLGTRFPRTVQLPIRVHRTRRWDPKTHVGIVHRLPGALILAAATFESARPACAILAAGVQQRLTTADDLERALDAAPRLRHRARLLAAVADIGQGSQALSEIDFYSLCRRHRLPLPERQAVRSEPSGRRRYLDASWRRPDGRIVVAEVDGAIHLAVRRWWDDQLRQNEITLSDAMVLRFPSVVVRTEPDRVAAQLRRALRPI